MSETAKFANVVLPGASFFEKSGTFTNGERRVQRVNEVIPPLAGTKTDGQIVVDIMNRMGIPQPGSTSVGVFAKIAGVLVLLKGAVGRIRFRWRTCVRFWNYCQDLCDRLPSSFFSPSCSG